MKKTSLYLDPEVDRVLASKAAAAGITKAEYVRRVLSAAAFEGERPRPRAKGVFDGARDLGTEAERHLAESGFGER